MQKLSVSDSESQFLLGGSKSKRKKQIIGAIIIGIVILLVIIFASVYGPKSVSPGVSSSISPSISSSISPSISSSISPSISSSISPLISTSASPSASPSSSTQFSSSVLTAVSSSSSSITTISISTTTVNPPLAAQLRINCLPQGDVSITSCEKKGCIWDKVNNGASCYLPQNYGYVSDSKVFDNDTRHTISLKRNSDVSIFGEDINQIAFEYEEFGNDVLHFRFYDPKNERYEVPVKDKWNFPRGPANSPRYEVNITDDDEFFSYQIIRKSTQAVLWDTSIGGLTFADKFLQIATHLPSNYIYGFGENHHKSFSHDLNYKTWPMFSRDEGISEEYLGNHYGVHPFYTCMEKDGKSHGVLFLNSNSMDYAFQPAPALILRTIGGVLDFYMFFGPSPESVIQQYTQMIGRTYIPPYWSLGFQISRWGYGNLDNMIKVSDRNRKANIPYDTQVADIDYMDNRRDFTYDKVNFKNLSQFVDKLHSNNMRFIIILDPAIEVNDSQYKTHQRGLQNDVYVKWPKEYIPHDDPDVIKNNNSMLGQVWPNGKVAFPDWFKTSTQEWWKEEINIFYKDIKFDGLWIDMNEPSNFNTNDKTPPWHLNCPKNEWDDPPYTSYASIYNQNNRLSQKTLCMIASQQDGNLRHYDVHSLYGWSEAAPTLQGAQQATGKRSMVVSRSTYPGANKYTTHWLGDNLSVWPELHLSIIGLLEFNLFGFPYIGADICGFNGDTTEEMCTRWQQLGAFYPFSRNHNSLGQKDQDPAAWSNSTIEIIRKTLNIRYRLLPHLYTLLFNAHSRGSTVVRPLFHEFFLDVNTYTIDKQFLWGSSFMISPALEKGQTTVNVYFPNDTWYDYYTGKKVNLAESLNHIIDAPIDFIPLHVRGGIIIPMQQPAVNTYYSRLNNFSLLIAMATDEETGEMLANGELFWDDGETIDTYLNKKYNYYSFDFKKDQLKIELQKRNGPSMSKYYIGLLKFFGINKKPNYVEYNGTMYHFIYDESNQVLSIPIDLPMDEDIIRVFFRDEPVPSKQELTQIDCSPDKDDKDSCLKRGCEWQETQSRNSKIPKCFFPDAGYVLKNMTNSTTYLNVTLEMDLELQRNSTNDLKNIKVVVRTEREDYLRITFYDPNSVRYEVLKTIIHPDMNADHNLTYTLNTSSIGEPFELLVIRNSSLKPIWKTHGGLRFEDQFLEITLELPSSNVYGFGENNHESLLHDLNFKSWGMFAKDQAPGDKENANMYGVHPFYICVEPDGLAHGVFLLNSNAMEYKFTPLPSLTLRSLGGILDFFLYMGPNPEDVVSQYSKMIGFSFSPPTWALGFQLSRYGYNSSKNMEAVVDRNKKAGIPFDALYADIDYLDQGKDFTYDKNNFGNLPELIKNLKDEGIHFMTILDPALVMNDTNYEPYKLINDVDGFIKWPNGSNMLGHVWPKGPVAFPDYLNPATKNITYKLIKQYHETIAFDGFWLDMNEPSNFNTNKKDTTAALFCPNNTWDDPPYKPDSILGDRLSDKTLCMIAVHYPNVSHYNVHNIYGRIQVETIREGFRQAFLPKRPMILSRSTYPGSGNLGGHWLGDNLSSWKHMRQSIIGCLEFNFFMISYVGANICGYLGDTTEELCERWMQLGSFYTFSRNHNNINSKDQDPAVFSPEVILSMKQALEIRYTLLPYLSTLFITNEILETTIMRAIFSMFPKDVHTWDIDRQFMWGNKIMFAPVLEKGKVTVRVYFPESRWFNYRNGEEIFDTGRTITIDAPRDIIPIYIKGGSIIPTQKPAQTVTLSRMNSFGLIVAPDENGTANGVIFQDDTDDFDFYKYYQARYDYAQYQLNTTVNDVSILMQNKTLDEIRLFGLPRNPDYITIYPISPTLKSQFNEATKELLITELHHPMNQDFRLTLIFK